MEENSTQISVLILLCHSGTCGDTYMQVRKGGMVRSILSVSLSPLFSKKENKTKQKYSYLVPSALTLPLSDFLSQTKSAF